MDFIIRDCGSIGYLGIIEINGKEVYRTGKHQRTKLLALAAMEDWYEQSEK